VIPSVHQWVNAKRERGHYWTRFYTWRTKGESPAGLAANFGTFDWMVGVYRNGPRYTTLPPKTRKGYDSALRLVSALPAKDGRRRFGDMALASITPGVADRIFERLKFRKDGSLRVRTAVLSVVCCKTAWNAAHRIEPKVVPTDNPFANMKLKHAPKTTRPVTHDELNRFAAAADAAGEPSIGTAAMIAYYWLQRQIDILSRLSWGHYKPDGKPIAKIWHHKTGKEVELPLFDDDGSQLWPELMARLDDTERRGTLIVMRDVKDRTRKIHLPWEEDYFRHRVADIRKAAGIDGEVKFMGLRHGGNTEGADADLSDAQLRALSGHKSSGMTQLYAKQTMKQRKAGARTRRDLRTNKDDLSE
jgi:hypothetical protein